MVAAAVHFHDLRIFARPLIDHDDTIFIEPLTRLDWSAYFNEWLPDRALYGFPLRDLTFYLDYAVSEASGVQTFWISNFLFLILGVCFISRIYRLLFLGNELLAAALTAVIALHPLNVEMVQWASMRKHLMASLFVAWGSVEVFRLYLDDKAVIRAPDLLRIFGIATASLFCWPNAIIWPLGCVWLLRRKLSRRKIVFLSLLGIVFWAVAFRVISGSNSDYARNETTLFTVSGFSTAFQWLWRSLGRATFNMLVPLREAAYYDADSPLNRIGLAMFFALLAGFGALTLKARRSIEESGLAARGWDILVYAVFLFAPQFFVVLINSGLVWADHYLYTCFPFVVAAFAIFVQLAFQMIGLRAGKAWVAGAWALLFTGYVSASVSQVPDWNDSITLLESCANRERAPLCLILTIEKKFDATGCIKAFPYFESARREYLERRERDVLKLDGPFMLELPFIESVCTAMAGNIGLAQKTEMLNELERVYQLPTSLLFARVLSHLEARDFDGAWELARKTYLDPEFTIDSPNEKLLILLEGQAEALCALSGGYKKHPECLELLGRYRARVRPHIFDGARKADVQRKWASAVSLKAYMNQR